LSETDKAEGKKMPLFPRHTQTRYIIFIAFAMSTLILALPLFEQTHLHVEIKQNEIIDVWVETPRVSLISTIISPSEGVGVNNIIITIQQTGQQFQLNDVPSGEYVEVWISNGFPTTGTYTINVELIQNSVTIDTFVLTVSF